MFAVVLMKDVHMHFSTPLPGIAVPGIFNTYHSSPKRTASSILILPWKKRKIASYSYFVNLISIQANIQFA